MLKINVDDNYDFIIENLDNEIYVDKKKIDLEIIFLGDQQYRIIHHNKSFDVHLLGFDQTHKILDVKINRHIHKVELKNENDLLLEKLGMKAKKSKKFSDMKAPMPGLIVDIKVVEGEEVKSGQPLIILKAMKMENILKSPSEGTIKSVMVEKNQRVEKGTALIQF